MNKIISDIINSNRSKEDKEMDLDVLLEDINCAKGILSGKYTYCGDCNDYYLSKSFFEETEMKQEKICTYCDPINSGGDEYRDGAVMYAYSVCPKGHKHRISRTEI